MKRGCDYCLSKGRCSPHCKRPKPRTKPKKATPKAVREEVMSRVDRSAGGIASCIKNGMDMDRLGRPIEAVTENLAYVRIGIDGYLYNICVTRSRLGPTSPSPKKTTGSLATAIAQ